MKYATTHPEAIKPHIAYSLAHNLYRLTDHSIAAVDEENGEAIIIELPENINKKE